MRALIVGLALFAAAPLTHAERCEMVGGCLGSHWYVHVPKGQVRTPAVFRARGMPAVNAEVVITQSVSLLSDDTFSDPVYLQQLRSDVQAAAKNGRSLPGWGYILRAGSRVRILSYRTFSQLAPVQEEVFAHVLVLSE